jgi:hypothetical protein
MTSRAENTRTYCTIAVLLLKLSPLYPDQGQQPPTALLYLACIVRSVCRFFLASGNRHRGPGSSCIELPFIVFFLAKKMCVTGTG